MQILSDSIYMAKCGTDRLLSLGSGEDTGYCCHRPNTKGNSILDLLHYRGIMV